tara:strand:+ start:249 stop:830 length:582 start_codon:yes stop_codon:yes gene_type:complete
MKKFYYIPLLLLLFFVSCKKETIEPIDTQETVESTDEIRLYGEWLLLDAKMYIENLETHERTVYNHFDSIKTTSSLRYSGSLYEIEDIEQNVTVWGIKQPNFVPGHGDFILNYDTIQPYGFYVTNSNWSIVEHPLSYNNGGPQIGGSSRPLEAVILDYEENIVNFYIQTSYENIDGWNCKYFTELTMIKITEW